MKTSKSVACIAVSLSMINGFSFGCIYKTIVKSKQKNLTFVCSKLILFMVGTVYYVPLTGTPLAVR